MSSMESAHGPGQSELREAFRRVLGSFPPRPAVDNEPYQTLAPTFEWSEWERRYVAHLGAEALDYILPEEDPGNAGYSRLRITYSGLWPDHPVTAYLRIPRRLTGPAPAVLCLHGHTAGCWLGKVWQDSTAAELARRGFVTLAPDAFPFGERRDRDWDQFEWENGKGSSHFWGERTWFASLILNGQTLQGLHVWELQRAVDVLGALPEVDPSRIGSIGHSGGGVNTLWIAAIDDRICCAVSSAGVQSYSRIATRRNPVAVWNLCPILTVGDTPDLVGLVAPRPFLGIEGIGDGDFDAEYNREHVYPAAREVYRRCGAEDRLEQSIHQGGHDYHLEQRQLGFAWLERWLRPGQ